MWPLKPDEGRILKDFLLNQSTATAKYVALAFVENAMTVEGADCLYQIEALVKIASETPPARQAKLIELLLEIRRLAIFATGGFQLIDYLDWQSGYANQFPILELAVIEEESFCATPKTRIKKWDSWKARFQAAQSEEHISIEAKNYTRTALAQMAKVEVLSKIDKQEWYKNTIYYQKYAARESNPVDLASELLMRRARLESLRSEITSQSSDERIPDRSAGNTKFETGETPYIGMGSTETHPSPNFPCVGSFCSDADEIELESGQISGDAASFRVFLHDFLDRSEAASRTFHYVGFDVSED